MLQQELVRKGENAAYINLEDSRIKDNRTVREELAIKEIIQVAYELNSEKTKDREDRTLAACAGNQV